MLPKYLVAITLLIAINSYADTALPPVTDALTPDNLANVHKTKYAIHRACKNEFNQKNLSDEERPAYIAACVKKAESNLIE